MVKTDEMDLSTVILAEPPAVGLFRKCVCSGCGYNVYICPYCFIKCNIARVHPCLNAEARRTLLETDYDEGFSENGLISVTHHCDEVIEIYGGVKAHEGNVFRI